MYDDITLIPYLARIQFGYGARRLLADELKALGVKRPFVVTDKGVVASGVLALALEALPRGYEVFDAVSPEPHLAVVEAALARYRDSGCDGLIGVGGGASLDTMKCVALLATHPAPLDQYRADRGGMPRITRAIAPMIAISTTSGSGSDLGMGAGMSIHEHEPKFVFSSPHLVPRVAICDPELTLKLPPLLTAATGIDAFSHALEGYLSPMVNPPAEAIALDAMSRVWRHLERAVHEPSNRIARWEVMMGATESGMRMGKNLGPAHALSIPLDTLGLHHGTLVGVLLPHTTRFLEDTVGAKLERVSAAIGALGSVADALADMNERIAMPSGLRVMGVTDEALARCAGDAESSFFNNSSPKRGTATDYLAMARAAM
jgi:4-hydroxybutyrate dehydrogenase